MSRQAPRRHDDHVNELLADRATQGLTPAESATLAGAPGASADDSFDLAAAAAMLASLEIVPAPASAHARAAIAADAHLAARRAARDDAPLSITGRSAPEHHASRTGASLGWLAAAACLFLAAASWAPRLRGTGSAGQPAQPTLSVAQVAAESDHVRWDWADGNDPSIRAVGGEVAFSPGKQSGVMTFRNLPRLDPSKEQYQLWIFDGERPAAHPVDGGVFDAPTGDGASIVTVPIRAKLSVSKPVMFAVTVERRGGVVVSDRSRIAVLAKPS